MATPGYLLMNEFHSESKKAKKEDMMDRGFVFDNAESVVNNFHHGEPVKVWLPKVREALSENAVREGVLEQEAKAYQDAIEMVEVFGLDYEVTFS